MIIDLDVLCARECMSQKIMLALKFQGLLCPFPIMTYFVYVPPVPLGFGTSGVVEIPIQILLGSY